MDDLFLETVEKVVQAIRLAGYDPYAQLTGYLRTNNDRYITRTGNARELVKKLDISELKHYVNRMNDGQQN